MKMVKKSCLVQQMIEKITTEVDAKIRFGKSFNLDWVFFKCNFLSDLLY